MKSFGSTNEKVKSAIEIGLLTEMVSMFELTAVFSLRSINFELN